MEIANSVVGVNFNLHLIMIRFLTQQKIPSMKSGLRIQRVNEPCQNGIKMQHIIKYLSVAAFNCH